MHNREIARQFQRLQALIKKCDEATAENIELQAHWAKYLCILSAGLLENAIKEIYMDYARNQTSRPIASFISSILSPIRNPKSQKFLEIAMSFNPLWKDELEKYLSDEGRGDAIDTIIGNRHLIAHGKGHNSNISLVQIKEYVAKAEEVLEYIEEICKR
jgi:RiboL-PSP-HEPN